MSIATIDKRIQIFSDEDLASLVELVRKRFLKQTGFALDAARKIDDELLEAIRTGQYEELLDAKSQSVAATIARIFAGSFVLAGDQTADFLSAAIGKPVEFNSVNPLATQQLQNERFRLITEFSTEQRAATREALVSGFSRGDNPRAQARNFRQSIGLTTRQQQAVDRYRDSLDNVSQSTGDALSRELRDRRFDPTVRAARRRGEPLTSTQIDRMVDRYSQRQLKSRSETIARTEALRAIHTGQFESLRQSVEGGNIDESRIIRTWVTGGGNVRPTHQARSGMKRGLNETFNGLRYPGDPNGSAAETVNCRCTLTTRVRPATNG